MGAGRPEEVRLVHDPRAFHPWDAAAVWVTTVPSYG